MILKTLLSSIFKLRPNIHWESGIQCVLLTTIFFITGTMYQMLVDDNVLTRNLQWGFCLTALIILIAWIILTSRGKKGE